MVIYSIVLVYAGLPPPADNPRVDDEQPALSPFLKVIKSPKSTEFPVDAIVI